MELAEQLDELRQRRIDREARWRKARWRTWGEWEEIKRADDDGEGGVTLRNRTQ